MLEAAARHERAGLDELAERGSEIGLTKDLTRLRGLARFAGACFHTARWDHNYDLNGKRVGFIGTGAITSAILPPSQVPRIADTPLTSPK